ncbi:MAG: T6SS immunity protein Tli4 family protein, partial [Smithellaceae bacterium]
MMRILRQLLIAAMISLILCGYGAAAVRKTNHKPTATTKGAQQGMKTYYMGRFAIDLPEEFKLEIQSHRFRLVEIEEYPNVQDTEQRWKNHLAKIEKLKKPKGANKIIIKEQPIDRLGKWTRGVLYYCDSMAADECKWDFLISYGRSTVLYSLNGLLDKEQVMYAWLKEVANAYNPYPSQKTPGNHAFYTQYGVIELPYKRQESTYARFAGPMGMKLEIDMNETHKVEETGLLESFAASLATNFAPGVDVDKIRTNKRKVAGLPGEELVTRLTADMGPELYFGWKYLGKE